MGIARVALGLAFAAVTAMGAPADAKTPKACRPCRVLCKDDVVATCANADPRLPGCSAKRRASCLRRAKRDCKRNLKRCCLKQCKVTGLVQCCGSATSSTPGSGGGGGTTTFPPTTTTTIPGTRACLSDADCFSCECCTAGGVCGGTTNAGQCCNQPGIPGSVMGACGPKSPSTCPSDAMCPPPGQLLGGTYYFCAYCPVSGNIVEITVPSGTTPPISTMSNSCGRR